MGDNLPKENELFAQARQFGLDECEIIEKSESAGTNEKDAAENDDLDDDTPSPSQEIINLVKDGNKHKYFVATQDKALSDKLRDMVYVPQLWLTRGVLLFDTPSAASRKVAQREERVKQKTGGGTMTSDESKLIRRLRDERIKKAQQENNTNNFERKRKKAKEPNPLSCKKKKTEHKMSTDGEPAKKKRRRKKKSSTEATEA